MRILRAGLTLVLLVGIVTLCAIVNSYKEPELVGVWCDTTDRTYMLEFLNDGTYIESNVMVPLPYTVNDSEDLLTIANPSGDITAASLVKNFGGTLTLIIDGVERTLKRVDSDFTVSGSETDGELVRSLGLVDNSYDHTRVNFYSNKRFAFSTNDISLSGRYAESSSGDLTLYYSSDEVLYTFDNLYKFGGYYVAGLLESSVSSNPVKKNAIEYGSIQLLGSVLDSQANIVYEFDSSGKCLRTTSNGIASEFMYNVDMDGLITLVDTANVGVEVNLFYDRTTNKVYRFVFEPDSWREFINGSAETE